MATLEKGIFVVVSGDPTVSGLVSTRIYRDRLPEGTSLPALVYQGISGPDHIGHDGGSGLRTVRYQFDAYSETASGAEEVIDAVRSVLAGYRGTTGERKIDGVLLDNFRGGPEPDSKLFRRSVDGLIHDAGSTT